MRNFEACERKVISATPARVGRKKRWAEDMQARFAEGTFARIAAVLRDGEDRTDFVREAVEAELATREQAPRKNPSFGSQKGGSEGRLMPGSKADMIVEYNPERRTKKASKQRKIAD